MILFKRLLPVFVLLLTLPVLTLAQTNQSPDDARTYIISPQDGQVVPPVFTVQFGLKGMGIAPAGNNIEGTGHHHLLIDVEELPELNLPLPASENLIHFGLGQTETVLTLPPGEHTLQLILGDYAHIPHDPAVISERITIYVEEAPE